MRREKGLTVCSELGILTWMTSGATYWGVPQMVAMALSSLLGQPKVCDLDLVNVVGSGQQQVFQLEISVHNTSAPDMTEE